MFVNLGLLAFSVCVVSAYIPMTAYKQQILNIHNDVRRMEPAANMQKMVRTCKVACIKRSYFI